MPNKIEAISKLLNGFDDDVLLRINNERNGDSGFGDYIYDNDEYSLDEVFSSVQEALRACCYGSYNYTDDYFIIDAYGNLESFNGHEIRNYIDIDALADELADTDCSEIQEVWLDDLIGYFGDFLYEKYGKDVDSDSEEFYNFVENYNLVTDDWDDIADDYIEASNCVNND